MVSVLERVDCIQQSQGRSIRNMVGFEYRRHSYSKLKNNVISFDTKMGVKWRTIPIIDEGPIPKLCPNFGLCACTKLKYSLLAQYHNTPLVPPPPQPKENCIGIVLDFPWDIFLSQEKLQTMIMQNFRGGKRGVLWDLCKQRIADFCN